MPLLSWFYALLSSSHPPHLSSSLLSYAIAYFFSSSLSTYLPPGSMFLSFCLHSYLSLAYRGFTCFSSVFFFCAYECHFLTEKGISHSLFFLFLLCNYPFSSSFSSFVIFLIEWAFIFSWFISCFYIFDLYRFPSCRFKYIRQKTTISKFC